jgi:hypothetical protein
MPRAQMFSLRRDRKQTIRGYVFELARQQHNHSSAVVIPSRNRAQQAMQIKFRKCCTVPTASRQPGLSLVDHWLRPKPSNMAPFITGPDSEMEPYGEITNAPMFNRLSTRDFNKDRWATIGRSSDNRTSPVRKNERTVDARQRQRLSIPRLPTLPVVDESVVAAGFAVAYYSPRRPEVTRNGQAAFLQSPEAVFPLALPSGEALPVPIHPSGSRAHRYMQH